MQQPILEPIKLAQICMSMMFLIFLLVSLQQNIYLLLETGEPARFTDFSYVRIKMLEKRKRKKR